MPRNTLTEQFRQSATEEQWKTIVSDHDFLSKEEFENKYRFSWSSILDDAASRGYYQKKRQYHPSSTAKNPDGSVSLFVSPIPADAKKISRSVQIYEDTYERLQKLEKDNSQYTNASILNQLLIEALEKHGY